MVFAAIRRRQARGSQRSGRTNTAPLAVLPHHGGTPCPNLFLTKSNSIQTRRRRRLKVANAGRFSRPPRSQAPMSKPRLEWPRPGHFFGSRHRPSYNPDHLLFGFRFFARSRTPGASPPKNSIPSASSVAWTASSCPRVVLGKPSAPSIRLTVETLTTARRARSRAVHRSKARAARTCAPEDHPAIVARRMGGRPLPGEGRPRFFSYPARSFWPATAL